MVFESLRRLCGRVGNASVAKSIDSLDDLCSLNLCTRRSVAYSSRSLGAVQEEEVWKVVDRDA